jgi:hypothetical protein
VYREREATARQIIKWGWFVDPDLRDSFNCIFEALERIKFKVRPGIDTRRALSTSRWSRGRQPKQFPPSIKKVNGLGAPDGIIAHLTSECGGNVHEHHVVDVTSGSFERETAGANPHSGVFDNGPDYAARVQLIWKPFYVSVQLITGEKKILGTRGTTGSATISRRGGLRQHTARSARMVVIWAGII